MPTGVDTYIIKVASRCNLNCTYCYYYHGADNSYLKRPAFMSMEVMRQATDRIIEHTTSHGITRIDISLHGGEPLLMSKTAFVEMMQEFDRIDAAGVMTVRKCQTNAVLLDEEWAKLLKSWNIRVGISLDGPQAVNDLSRVDHAGRGSYDRVVRGLQVALEHGDSPLGASVLSVINPQQDGAEAYRHLRGLGVERMDFLLPESNHAYPPAVYDATGQTTPYADFLCGVLDAWLAEDNPDTHVRLLSHIIGTFLGEEVRSDVIGDAPVQVAVIEADGSIEPTDNFKACVNGMTDLGLSVFEHTFDDLYHHPFFSHCVDAASNVPTACQSCRHLDRCGGGRITTRYSLERGFDNPTIYCADLLKVYDRVEGIVQAATLDEPVSPVA